MHLYDVPGAALGCSASFILEQKQTKKYKKSLYVHVLNWLRGSGGKQRETTFEK